MVPSTVHRTILSADVADFTNPSRNGADLRAVQEGVYQVLRTAFAECGIDYESCDTDDRGDGALIFIPPEISKSTIADRLPDRLVVAVRRHNATRAPASQFKLRVGIHAGEVQRNTEGWIGWAVNDTARIIDADEVKTALKQSDGVVAWVVSDYFYREVVAQDPGVAPEQYRRFDVAVKRFSGTIWLWLPGATGPPAIPLEPPPPVHAVLDNSGFDVFTAAELADLRNRLSNVEVPHPATLVARAVGPAIPPPRPTSAWEIFEYLADFNAGPDGVPPALAWLRLLAREVGGDVRTSVSAWVEQQTQRLRRTELLDKAEDGWGSIDEPQLYLMIVVESDAIDPTRCRVSYWRQDDPQVWPPARSDVIEVAVDELEYRVDDIILAAEEVWGAGHGAAVVLEIVLPRSLITIPVQRWRKEHSSGAPQPLVFDYQVRLRSLERMLAPHWRRAWKRRWLSVGTDSGLGRVHPFGPVNSGARIDAVLSDPRWLGVVLERPPTPQPTAGEEPDPLIAAYRAGLPLVVWHPDMGPDELRQDVDWLLGGSRGLMDLPVRRQEGLVSDSNCANLYDLVVMWEDPERVISLTRPSASKNPQ